MMLEYFKSDILPLKNKLYRFAYSILGDGDLAKDVVQETMMKAWEKRLEFGHIQNPEAWCMTLTRNFALDKLRSKHYKTQGLEHHFDLTINEQSPYKLIEMGNIMAVIDTIVASLPLKQKETFVLRDVEGYSYQEICELTGNTISDVKVNIFRARKTIRMKLLKLNSHGLEKSRSAS